MEISSRGFLGYPWYYQHDFLLFLIPIFLAWCILKCRVISIYFIGLFFRVLFLCIMLVMLNKSNQIKSKMSFKKEELQMICLFNTLFKISTYAYY